MVRDVLGNPVRSDAAGVLFHEHIQFGWPGFLLDPKAEHGIDEDRAALCLEEVAAAGVSVLVDATPIECGQDLQRLARIARKTEVQIIGATGIYHRDRGYPAHLASLSVGELVELFELDLALEEGGANAGVLKVATSSPPFAKREERAIRAAAIVSREHGVPIVTHTDGIASAREQLRIFREERAPTEHIVLGHLDTTSAHELADLIEEAGTFVGIDRFGHGDDSTDDSRIALVMDLMRRGLGRSILIAHDAPLLFLGRIVVRPPDAPNPFTHISRNIAPRLVSMGASESDIKMLVRDNPLRFLGVAL